MDSADEAAVLERGEVHVEGRLRAASNTTLLCTATLDGVSVRCVYKPRKGERPLWDFPTGTLGYREVAAFDVTRALAWDLVPTTIWRDDAPLGPGMCQAWRDTGEVDPVQVLSERDVPRGWRVVAEGEGMDGESVCLAHEDAEDLRRLSLFDLIANNTDRKGGHVLRDPGGRLAGIDHGLTFHVEDKVRTVLWGWAGEPLTSAERESLERFRRGPAADEIALAEAAPGLARLSRAEVRSVLERLDHLLAGGAFPVPYGGWPALPWPAM